MSKQGVELCSKSACDASHNHCSQAWQPISWKMIRNDWQDLFAGLSRIGFAHKVCRPLVVLIVTQVTYSLVCNLSSNNSSTFERVHHWSAVCCNAAGIWLFKAPGSPPVTASQLPRQGLPWTSKSTYNPAKLRDGTKVRITRIWLKGDVLSGVHNPCASSLNFLMAAYLTSCVTVKADPTSKSHRIPDATYKGWNAVSPEKASWNAWKAIGSLPTLAMTLPPGLNFLRILLQVAACKLNLLANAEE